MKNNVEYWFPAKRYGWGWGPPVAWQGWVLLIGWLVVFSAVSLRFNHQRGPWIWAFRIGMPLFLIAVCYLKGEPPKWRWGDSDR